MNQTTKQPTNFIYKSTIMAIRKKTVKAVVTIRLNFIKVNDPNRIFCPIS